MKLVKKYQNETHKIRGSKSFDNAVITKERIFNKIQKEISYNLNEAYISVAVRL